MKPTAKTAPLLPLETRLRVAQEWFLKYHTRCFWSYKKDSIIKESDIPWVAKALRKHGGKEGFLIASDLCR